MSVAEFPSPIEGTSKGENPDTGQMFDVPRVAVAIDEADPNVLRLAISGTYELDRGNPQHVHAYNRLTAGESCELVVEVYCVGSRQTHRRDSEGSVDAIVQTKGLRVDSVFLDTGEAL